ncbi:hypothetical protein ACFLYU_00665 [Candidatus Dependentiae bacterium]
MNISKLSKITKIALFVLMLVSLHQHCVAGKTRKEAITGKTSEKNYKKTIAFKNKKKIDIKNRNKHEKKKNIAINLKKKIDDFFYTIAVAEANSLQSDSLEKELKHIFTTYFDIFENVSQDKEIDCYCKINTLERILSRLTVFVEKFKESDYVRYKKEVKIEHFLRYRLEGFLYKYEYVFNALLSNTMPDISLKGRVRALLEITKALKKYFQLFLAKNSFKNESEKNKKISEVIYGLEQFFSMIASFRGKNFLLAMHIFSGDVSRLRDFDFDSFKDSTAKKTYSSYIDLASNIQMKSFLIQKFFCKKEEKEKLRKCALEKLKRLKELRIKNMIIKKEFLNKDNELFYLYAISRIEISQKKCCSKKRAFIIKLPCLQQVGATCGPFSFIHSKIFSQNNDLLGIIKQLHSVNDLIKKAKLGVFIKLYELNKLFDGKLLCKKWRDKNRFKLRNKNVYVNVLKVDSDSGLFFYDNEMTKCFKLKNSPSQVIVTIIKNSKGNHLLSAKVDKTEHGDLVVFYADSEGILKNFYSENIFEILSSHFGYYLGVFGFVGHVARSLDFLGIVRYFGY